MLSVAAGGSRRSAMTKRVLLVWLAASLAGVGAFAAPPDPADEAPPTDAPVRFFPFAPAPSLDVGAPRPSIAASVRALAAEASSDSQVTTLPRPVAFEYSDGYYTRLKIHKYASYATIPLFAAQFAVGQKLYNGNGSDGTRSVHGALAVATGALFTVNTVTGVWNMIEARKDPHKSTKRTVHGVLMLLADAGFVATGLLTPEEREREFGVEGGGGGTSRSTHRAVALTSMGIATVAYLMMLIH